MNNNWPGVLEPEKLNTQYVSDINALADAAKTGNWVEVMTLLDSNTMLTPNNWRVSGHSWFAPLHQAAWLGAPTEVVEQLIQRGAWRSLRDADGNWPVDIARTRGHSHLFDVLNVPENGAYESRKFAAWDQYLAELIAQRTQGLEPLKIRQVPTEIIALEQLKSMWFGYPGMYGGFSISIYKRRLFVESWCRVAGGSGQAHVITESGCVLVEKGFV